MEERTFMPPPAPPRRSRRWLRRVSFAVLALVVVAVASHAIWGVIESRRLRARIFDLQRAGEPIFPAEFNTSAIDSTDNGGADVLAAADNLAAGDPELMSDFDQLPGLALPLRAREKEIIAKLLP